jgi:hypothetical protein
MKEEIRLLQRTARFQLYGSKTERTNPEMSWTYTEDVRPATQEERDAYGLPMDAMVVPDSETDYQGQHYHRDYVQNSIMVADADQGAVYEYKVLYEHEDVSSETDHLGLRWDEDDE